MTARATTERQLAGGACPRCGLPLDTHPRCASCGILLGKNHYSVEIIERGGETYCKDCAERKDKREGSQALQEGSGATKGGEQW